MQSSGNSSATCSDYILFIGTNLVPDFGSDIASNQDLPELIYANSIYDAANKINKSCIAVFVAQNDSGSSTETAVNLIRTHEHAGSIPIVIMASPLERHQLLNKLAHIPLIDFIDAGASPTEVAAKINFISTYKSATSKPATRQTTASDEARRMRLIFDNTREYAFIMLDEEGVITEWEGGATNITGWNAGEVMGMTVYFIFTPEDRAAHRPQMEIKCALEKGRAEDKRWHLRKDGSRFFADGVLLPILENDGSLCGFFKIFRDATREQLDAENLVAAETRLRESQNLFASLLQSSADGISGMAADTSCTFINPAAAQMLGYEPDELVGRPIHDVIHHHRSDGSEYPAGECLISKAARAGDAIRVEDEVFWRKDGTPVPVSYSVAPIISEGKNAGAVVSFTNVSSRRQLEAERSQLFRELEAANSRMADVFKQAPAFMCILRGPDHIFELVNEKYYQLVGRQDLVGRAVRDAFPDVQGQGFFELLDKVYLSGEPFVGVDMLVTIIDSEKKSQDYYLDFVYMPIKDANGIISGILAHGVDQTHRKKVELELRASEERYRTLFESMDQAFCVIQVFDEPGSKFDYQFLEVNPAFETQTSLSGVLGKRASEVIASKDLASGLATYATVAKTRIPTRFERQALNKWFDVYATPIGDAAESKVALLFTDITQRKLSDENLRQLATDLSEADRRKTQFLATLAHELRNPLAPLLSGLAVLKMDVSDETLKKVRGIMERQIDQMVHLIDDLLDVARISGDKIELQKTSVDIRSIISSALETSAPLMRAAQHEVIVEQPDYPILVDADPTRISQVVSNLLNNAAKYTTTAGKITVHVERVENDVAISVTDTGIGIPPDFLKSVFDMFSQVSQHVQHSRGGLGIGLSLVKRLVEMHGGSVEAQSGGLGTGSKFTVRLPLGSGNQHFNELANDTNLDKDVELQPLKILVIDDNRDAADMLSTMLEFAGHNTNVAYDGMSGLSMARELKPDVAFVDIGMPGMNGYDVAKAFAGDEEIKQATLVAVTGWGTENDRARSAAAGFKYHLTKPTNLTDVEAVLNAAR